HLPADELDALPAVRLDHHPLLAVVHAEGDAATRPIDELKPQVPRPVCPPLRQVPGAEPNVSQCLRLHARVSSDGVEWVSLITQRLRHGPDYARRKAPSTAAEAALPCLLGPSRAQRLQGFGGEAETPSGVLEQCATGQQLLPCDGASALPEGAPVPALQDLDTVLASAFHGARSGWAQAWITEAVSHRTGLAGNAPCTARELRRATPRRCVRPLPELTRLAPCASLGAAP